jgi:surface carbohydrate biosynthesis protein
LKLLHRDFTVLNSTSAILRKIGKKVFEFIKAKKVFKPPKKAKILVVDDSTKYLLEPLFNGEPFEVFHTRGEVFNLSPSMLYRCLLCWVRERTIKYSYFIAYIDQVSPAIIITYIDNSRAFQQVDLRNKDKRKKFVAIANGTRKFSGSAAQVKLHGPSPKDIFHSNLFCLGQCCVDEYIKHGAHVLNFSPVGSLQDSYFRDSSRRKRNKSTFDICLVVTALFDTPYDTIEFGDGRQSFELFLGYLRVFSERNNVKISATSKVLEDTKESEIEFKWLQRFLGNHFTYFPQKYQVPSSTYFVSDEAKVVIGFASTILRECFGRRKKVLQINYSDDPFHDLPFEGIWLLKESGFPTFEKRLLDILSMDQLEYNKQCKHYPEYLIGHNDSKPAFVAISEFIQQHIQKQDEVI